jgi:aminomethyltransferase
MTEDRRSPLHDWQVSRGAEFIWEDGWPWAMTVGDTAVNEYEAIRTGTGLWDLFSTQKYVVEGPDATELIQRRFTNDLAGLKVGGVRYGAFVNPDGLMVDDGNVYKLADDRYWVMINTGDLEGWFRESGNDLNATIGDRSAAMPMIGVQGPTSREVLGALTDYDLSGLGYFQIEPEEVRVAGKPARIQRTGFSGEVGFEVVPSSIDDAVPIWEALVDQGGKPFGLEAVDIARIEVGLVIIGMDYQPGETSPWDISMDRFIKTTTSCVGNAALTEAGAAPSKRLMTLTLEGDDLPEGGAAVTKDGKQVGSATSPATSPRLGPISLAVLDADVATVGEKVEVEGAGIASVEVLSLLDPNKERPRG